MKLNNLFLDSNSIAPNIGATAFQVANCYIQYKYRDNQKTDSPEYYIINIVVRRGDVLKVKFRPEKFDTEKFKLILDALHRNESIMVEFSNLIIRPYAMLTQDNKLISGVTATADDFSIVEEQEIIL